MREQGEFNVKVRPLIALFLIDDMSLMYAPTYTSLKYNLPALRNKGLEYHNIITIW